MHGALRATVVPRHVAPLEAPVDDMREPRRPVQDAGGGVAQRRRATRAVRGPEIEIGQAPREEARHFRADRVAVEEHSVAMAAAHALDLAASN